MEEAHTVHHVYEDDSDDVKYSVHKRCYIKQHATLTKRGTRNTL
jgi:hypothetical protein